MTNISREAVEEWVRACALGLVGAEDLAPVMFALRDALDRASWQPIETAPLDGTRVLLYVGKYGVSTGHFDMFGPSRKWSCHSVLNREAQPTHWMPLPYKPQEDVSDG